MNRFRKLMDHMTGSYGEQEYRYRKISYKDLDVKILKEKNQRHKLYLLVLFMTLFLCIVLIVQMYQDSSYLMKAGSQVISIRRDNSHTKEYKLKVSSGEDSGYLSVKVLPENADLYTESRKEEPDILDNDFSQQISDIKEQIERNPATTIVTLPEYLEDGTKITYMPVRDYTILYILMLGILLTAVIYLTRFDALKKAEREAASSIIMELPHFINNLTILLKGGIILDNAFDRISAEYSQGGYEESYFCRQFVWINQKVKETNSSYEKELRAFARDSGVHELIRVVNVMSDNITKGAMLVGKLEAENRYLWQSKKKESEALGRMADTKLTLPLVLLLIVLIVITIAPAMLQM